MAGEWIGTAIGGGVGVTGTLGAMWLTHRREADSAARRRREQILDERRQEKREVFLRMLGAITDLEDALSTAVHASHKATAYDERVAVLRAVRRMARLTGEVDLVTDGPDVRECWLAVCADTNRLTAGVTTVPATGGLVDGGLTTELVLAMKAELDATRS